MGTAITLYHNHYDKSHLEEVKKEMLELGAPVINCWYDEANSLWFAVEGCHRLRAAHALGITPIINDITDDWELTYEVDGDEVTVDLDQDFFDEWYNHNYSNVILDFEEDDIDG